MCNGCLKTGAAVVLYHPDSADLQHMNDYVNKVDRTIVVDNSEQPHIDEIKSIVDFHEERVRYSHHPENLGLCRALNLAVKELATSGCEWVLIMNPDSSFQTDILDVFQSYLQSHKTEDIAIIGPIYDYDRKRSRPYGGTKCVGRIMLSGCLFNTKVFKELGGFEEELFVDGLDWDYCLKAKKAGYEIIECGQAILNHKPAITKELKVNGKSVFQYGTASPQRYYYMARASIWLFRKYKNPYDLAEWIWRLIKILLLFDDKKIYIKWYCEGTREGMRLLVNRQPT